MDAQMQLPGNRAGRLALSNQFKDFQLAIAEPRYRFCFRRVESADRLADQVLRHFQADVPLTLEHRAEGIDNVFLKFAFVDVPLRSRAGHAPRRAIRQTPRSPGP